MALPTPTPAARELLDRIAAHLPATGRLGVAFSGGVDSTVLLAASYLLLGPERTLGIIAVSPSLARREYDGAHAVAGAIGATVVEVHTHEDEIPEYQRNNVDRCYFCKSDMFTHIDDELVAAHQLTAVAYGENADDARRSDRPGALAATEHHVRRPLADAGLTKADVRRLAGELQLPVADKPASPCLASRIPHGLAVVPEKLRQIEAVEDALHELGLSDCRVRHHERIARIEVPTDELARVVDHAQDIVAAALTAGFTYATLDLRGLQLGAFTTTAMGERP